MGIGSTHGEVVLGLEGPQLQRLCLGVVETDVLCDRREVGCFECSSFQCNLFRCFLVIGTVNDRPSRETFRDRDGTYRLLLDLNDGDGHEGHDQDNIHIIGLGKP